jgi:hypothetical protein
MGVEEFPHRTKTIVFYPARRGVSVTNRIFKAFGSAYPIGELSGVVWGAGSVQTARRMTVRLVAVEALIAIIIVASTQTYIAVLAAFGYLLLAATTIRLAVHRWPTPLELWADYRGEPTKLYVSTNHTEFHQVTRALQRALEYYASGLID